MQAPTETSVALLQLLQFNQMKRIAEKGRVKKVSSGLKAKRAMYSDSQRDQLIAVFKDETKDGMKEINGTPGYEKVDKNMIYRWMRNTSRKKIKTGRKYCVEFEDEVWSNCILYNVLTESDHERFTIVANCCYSYDVIRHCANTVLETLYKVVDSRGRETLVQKWKLNSLTMNLKFSNKWISAALRRKLLKRRRVTTSEKVEPTVLEIRTAMGDIQKVFNVMKHFFKI